LGTEISNLGRKSKHSSNFHIPRTRLALEYDEEAEAAKMKLEGEIDLIHLTRDPRVAFSMDYFWFPNVVISKGSQLEFLR
jgi:hypothetical protein